MQKTLKIDWQEKFHHYEPVFPPHKWWTWGALTDSYNWCFPGNGYRQAIPAIWNNVILFLTPWYRPFRQLLSTFRSKNGMKLLGDGRNYTFLRTRDYNQFYYTLRKRWLFWAELEEMVYIDNKIGKQVNAFGAGISAFISGATVEETEERYDERRRVVCRGFIMTRRSCQRMMDRIVALTDDKIDWYFPENKEYDDSDNQPV